MGDSQGYVKVVRRGAEALGYVYQACSSRLDLPAKEGFVPVAGGFSLPARDFDVAPHIPMAVAKSCRRAITHPPTPLSRQRERGSRTHTAAEFHLSPRGGAGGEGRKATLQPP